MVPVAFVSIMHTRTLHTKTRCISFYFIRRLKMIAFINRCYCFRPDHLRITFGSLFRFWARSTLDNYSGSGPDQLRIIVLVLDRINSGSLFRFWAGSTPDPYFGSGPDQLRIMFRFWAGSTQEDLKLRQKKMKRKHRVFYFWDTKKKVTTPLPHPPS